MTTTGKADCWKCGRGCRVNIENGWPAENSIFCSRCRAATKKTSEKLHFSPSDSRCQNPARLVTKDATRVTCLRCRKVAARALQREVQELIKLHGEGWYVAEKLWDIGDKLSQQLASVGLEELLSKWTDHGYRPTLRGDVNPMALVLADIYDYAMTRRGIDVVAYRGS